MGNEKGRVRSTSGPASIGFTRTRVSGVRLELEPASAEFAWKLEPASASSPGIHGRAARAATRSRLAQERASLIALMGRARTDLLAGLALKTIGSPVKGFLPSRSLVAGFFTTRNFAKPGTVKMPFRLSSL